jgi:hypothetical protein
LTGIGSKTDVETGAEKAWLLKDLRKTFATYYDEHVSESSIEILGHAVRGIAYHHYAPRAPLAFKVITNSRSQLCSWHLRETLKTNAGNARKRFKMTFRSITDSGKTRTCNQRIRNLMAISPKAKRV